MSEYPKMQVWSISDIYIDSENNPRVISEERKEYLKKSIDELGVIQPIVVNSRSGRLLSGHQRLNLLSDESKQVEAWTVDLDEFKENAAIIALNNEVGEFDDYSLSKILKDLDSEDLQLTGFSSHEISRVIEDIDTSLEEGSEEISENMDIYKISLNFSSLDNKFRWEKFIETCKAKAEHNRPVTDYMFQVIDKIQSGNEVY